MIFAIISSPGKGLSKNLSQSGLNIQLLKGGKK